MSSGKEKLAIHGGPQTKTTPYGKAERYADNELAYLKEALAQNTLFYGHGTMVKRACASMTEYTGRPYVVPCSSGSAAIHLGLIACGIGPGDEVVTTPNTDTGTVAGIIEEGAVPVFCDCERTLQPSAATVAAKLTDRTRAVVVVHLAGYPAPVDEIVALCAPRGIGVVEDCAQSWGTRLNGRLVGTTGTAGAYSVNDFKHISAGDGGFVTLADEHLYRRVSNYSDKHYDRLFDLSQRQAHHGINYRMGELQGAVVLAQLEKVDRITGRQNEIGDTLREKLSPLRGADVLAPLPGGYSTYWWTVLLLEPEAVTATRDELVAAISAEGVAASSYGTYDLIQKPLFAERVVRPWLEPPRSMYPFVQPDGREYTYSLEQTPTHGELLQCCIMLSIGSYYTDQDVEETARGVLKVFDHFLK